MNPKQEGSPNDSPHHSFESGRWWSNSVPILPSEQDTLHQGESFILTPPVYLSKPSDLFLFSQPACSPNDASTTGFNWPDEPITRSMSANALSSPGQSSTGTQNTTTTAPRQIRFVSTDHGQPHSKRRRILAACLTCRRRKTRCSGEKPACKTCSENGHECSGYAEGPHHKSPGHNGSLDREVDSQSSSPHQKPASSRKDGRRPSSIPLEQPATLPWQQSGSASEGDSVGSAPFVQAARQEYSSELKSPDSVHTAGSITSGHNRVPYFRYFGPTALVPGFKQMVVQMKDHRRGVNSVSGDSPASGAICATPSMLGQDRSVDIPFYDATDPTPNAPIITELCQTFFTHLGCNYPFLQRERFLRDLEDKRVDAILVDAVCAVSARFSSHQILSYSNDQSVPVDTEGHIKRAFRGHPFAHRAMAAVIGTFPCPTIAVAQACLLLAYEEFGTDHDSGLWMYLGTSIRMAQDLGIQKLEGLQLIGRVGPTPKTAKNGAAGKEEERRRATAQRKLSRIHENTDGTLMEDRIASESERIDTFYCIFFLDRAVSSGVGRPVTLRDKDIEISFPYIADDQAINGWPHPFPPLIRIVHMYGRVADVLNNIKEVTQVTPDVLKRLAGMEKEMTGIYQGLSPKLHFNATNFQHYVKAEQGTNFILLHFWFHTLIVLLHQPTLLHSFEGRIQQLFPDSRELSMSSAKTIADILAFAELIDVKSFIGNPFTSQPMYIAACAFLAEAAQHASQPPSRSNTPPDRTSNKKASIDNEIKVNPHKAKTAKHTLLAAAANQNYQRCYKALKMLDSYWAGCRYILTALDQKLKGLMDPLLFTQDDLDGDMPSTEPSFTTPGWRRTMSNSASMGGPVGTAALNRIRALGSSPNAPVWSPKLDHSQAIGWSLTGTTNSPAPNLSFLYQAGNTKSGGMSPVLDAQSTPGENRPRQAKQMPTANMQVALNYHNPSSMMPPPPPANISSLSPDTVASTEADLLLNLNSPYPSHSTQSINSETNNMPQPMMTVDINTNQGHTFDYAPQPMSMPYFSANEQQQTFATPTASANTNLSPNFGDLLIETQDVDMTDSQGAFTFPDSDMFPWLEYLPQDVLNYFSEAPANDPTLPSVLRNGAGPPENQ